MAIKVSQATIDKIKKMGMTKALAGTKSANPEMREALTRMYGARRVAAASAPAVSTRRKYGTPNVTSKPKMVDAKGPNAVKTGKFNASRAASASLRGANIKDSMTAGRTAPRMPGKGPAANMAKKKSTTTDPVAKAIFGGLGALGRTLSVEPRVTAAQAKKNLEAKKRAAANKNK
jgi:hypothetical protein